MLARASVSKGDPQKGIKYTDRAVRLSPNSWVSRYLHGNQLLLAGRYRDAIPHLTQASKLNSRSALISYSLIKSYLFAGMPLDAMPHLVTLINREKTPVHIDLAIAVTKALQADTPIGFCYAENNYTAAGWAWDPRFGDQYVAIQVVKNKVPVLTCKANLFRKPLLDAGMGNGRCGFRFRLPEGFSFENVTFRIITTDNEIYPIYCPDTRPDESVYEGELFVRPPNELYGWVWNKSDPLQRLSVVLEDASNIKMEVSADVFDLTLLRRGIGDGRYAFRVKWLFSKDLSSSISALITARVQGTKWYLSGGPCAVIDPIRQHMAFHQYAGWLKAVHENPYFPPALPGLLHGDFLTFIRQHNVSAFFETSKTARSEK